MSTATLKTATQEELIAWVNDHASHLHTLDATVDIATSVGGAMKEKVTEYKEIRGYILEREPESLRIIGLLPVIRNRAFDLVSDGTDFKLWIPPANKFYIGRNESAPPDATGLLSLRPQILYDALLLRPINPQDEIAVMESGMQTVFDPKRHRELEQPDYRLNVIRHSARGWRLLRKLYFDRVDLIPYKETVYDPDGKIFGENLYDEWKTYGDVSFPFEIQIWQPVGEYRITFSVVKLVLNQQLTDQQFTLEQPAGVQVIRLAGAPPLTAHDGASR
jgi:hypothetical protein